ncbi:MAG: class I SAM-dependent methyltransferase [Candidatus Kapabacteria bacterium]|nr:class I SAM-dependent methyltransferase [Candidatus Kapabacteria bacterium]
MNTLSGIDPVAAIASSGLHPRVVHNWITQYRLAEHTLIPWLRREGVLTDGASIAEIGCAEGGVLMACAEVTHGYALGTDIQGELLSLYSSDIARRVGLDITFTQHDVIYEDVPAEWEHRFEVVLLRDVLEHLDDTFVALRNIRRLLKPGGILLITFPPYTSAFGGHQQLLETAAGKLPFVHMLPRPMFEQIIRGSSSINTDEVRRLASIRLSAERVRKAARREDYELVDERYFMLRPVFKWKYKEWIPTLDVTSIKHLPGIQQLAMEAAFLLRRPL